MARTNTNTGSVAPTGVTSLDSLTGDITLSAGSNISFNIVGQDIEISSTGGVISVNGQTGVVVLDTDDVPEGATNLYWTQGRFDTAFNTAFSLQTTDDLTEGITNFYYTDARVVAATTGLYVHLTGDETIAGNKTFSIFPTLPGTMPVNDTDAVNKLYADAIALGFRFKASVQAATVIPLAASTYNNGASGVGATITANANGAIADIDTYVVQIGDRLLIKDQADPIQNGIYTATDLGSAGTPFILTRATDFDSMATMGQGAAVLVLNGTPYSPPGSLGNYASQFAVLTADPIVPGTDQIIWSRISLPLQYFAGTGLILTGTTFSLDADLSPIAVANGSTLYSIGLTNTGVGSVTGNNIIFGNNAGFNATNVFSSIFLGTDSGTQATNAFQSIFIGQQAGYQATSAQSSVFLGLGAGFNATAASGSNFIGRDAGSGASGAFSAVFFGNSAGGGATSAQHAVFLGSQAGQGATNAAYAVFIGDQAGLNDGVSSGLTSAILIGRNTSTGGFDNSIAIGGFATNSAANQFLINSSVTQFNMRGVNYTMPSANAAGSLVNNGSGVLSWGAASSQFQFLRNATALTRTASTVLTLVPSMTANVTSGKIYQFTVTLFTTSNVAGGVKAAITLAGGATGTILYQGDAIQNATAITSSRAAVQNTAVAAVTAVTAATIHITGTFVCTVSGVMRVTFGQNVSNAAASVVLANSIFQVTQIN